jgi:hypothetical protein
VRTVPIQFLRFIVGLLAVLFAYGLGRVATRLRRNHLPMTKALTWFLRTAVAVLAILWTRGFDSLGIVLLSLTALSCAAGVYIEMRPRKTEEIHLFDE